MGEDRYSDIDYKRLIAWGPRLAREWPFLDEMLANAPSRKVLDLGSGTGEHARFLAERGYEVVGVDSSPAMVEKSRAEGAANVRFVEGDLREVQAVLGQERFGAAICLGNVLPHLTADDDLIRLASSVGRALEPGAPLLIQMLNYDRIESKSERALPLSFLPDPDERDATLVFLRAIEMKPEGRAVFMPTTLRQRDDRSPPMELLSSRRVEIRTWRIADLERALTGQGFDSVTAWGSYARAPFDPAESRDLIVVARSA